MPSSTNSGFGWNPEPVWVWRILALRPPDETFPPDRQVRGGGQITQPGVDIGLSRPSCCPWYNQVPLASPCVALVGEERTRGQ